MHRAVVRLHEPYLCKTYLSLVSQNTQAVPGKLRMMVRHGKNTVFNC